MYKKLLAISTLSGTVIGVGLFGLPYVTAQVGFLPMLFYFLVLTILIVNIDLMYGEIAARTKSNHRLIGYSAIYLGRGAKTISYISSTIGLTGSLLVYIVVGGKFLASFLMPFLGGSVILYSLIFFLAGAWLIFAGSGPISKTEFFSLGIFFAVLILVFVKSWPHLALENFLSTRLDLKNFFLPYGVILFSISGTAVIPEIKEMLKNQAKSLKKIIVIGLIIPAVTYLLFIVSVYGITGANTTEEGMVGLNLALGGGISMLGFLFGVITTFTSFITLGITLKKSFNYDLGISKKLSWLAACFPALILYLLGLNDFIAIIGFLGAIAMGVDTIIIALTYLRAKKFGQRSPAYSLKMGRLGVSFIVFFALTGIIIELARNFY